MSMLASSATNNSETQTQLLKVLGRTRNVQKLEGQKQITKNVFKTMTRQILSNLFIEMVNDFVEQDNLIVLNVNYFALLLTKISMNLTFIFLGAYMFIFIPSGKSRNKTKRLLS